MPLVSSSPAQGQQTAPALYGVGKQEPNIMFQERLAKRFKEYDYVTIKNISNKPIYWQYMPEKGETESFDATGMMKSITRTDPEAWYIPANGTDVMVGACAYLALDVLYKQLAADKTFAMYRDPDSPQFDEKGQHLPKNFNYSDGGFQDRVINEAYLGKAQPVFENYQPIQAEGFKTPQPQVAPETPHPNSDDQIPNPTTAPNGVPAPQSDEPATDTTRIWPEPVAAYATPDKTPVKAAAGATKR